MYMQTSTYQQETHYYPYGGLMGESTGGDVQRYKYNGKELDRMHGLDWYDYGARHYDAAVGSWPTMDPLAEKYYSVSPYAYCGGNPVNMIDKDGQQSQKPDIWEIIMSVIPKELFIGWRSPFVKNNTNCFELAKKQINIMGYTVGGSLDLDNLYPYDENKGVNKNDTQKAVDYIHSSLKAGIPILVGVDDAEGSPNTDNTTDHFVVIVGMGHDDKGNYFQVYDNATSNRDEGTNQNNKLYYNNRTMRISGTFTNPYAANSPRPYTVSQVRKSRKINRRRK